MKKTTHLTACAAATALALSFTGASVPPSACAASGSAEILTASSTSGSSAPGEKDNLPEGLTVPPMAPNESSYVGSAPLTFAIVAGAIGAIGYVVVKGLPILTNGAVSFDLPDLQKLVKFN